MAHGGPFVFSLDLIRIGVSVSRSRRVLSERPVPAQPNLLCYCIFFLRDRLGVVVTSELDWGHAMRKKDSDWRRVEWWQSAEVMRTVRGGGGGLSGGGLVQATLCG
jgi:hypothetical protein